VQPRGMNTGYNKGKTTTGVLMITKTIRPHPTPGGTMECGWGLRARMKEMARRPANTSNQRQETGTQHCLR